MMLLRAKKNWVTVFQFYKLVHPTEGKDKMTANQSHNFLTHMSYQTHMTFFLWKNVLGGRAAFFVYKAEVKSNNMTLDKNR